MNGKKIKKKGPVPTGKHLGPKKKDKKRNAKGQFVPGVSGHPEGRKSGSISIVAKIRAELEKMPPELNSKKKNSEEAKEYVRKLLDIPKEEFDKLNLVKLLQPLKDKTYADLVIRQYFRKILLTGDNRVLLDLVDRIDGKPKESVELTGRDGNSIEVNINIKKTIEKIYGDNKPKGN